MKGELGMQQSIDSKIAYKFPYPSRYKLFPPLSLTFTILVLKNILTLSFPTKFLCVTLDNKYTRWSNLLHFCCKNHAKSGLVLQRQARAASISLSATLVREDFSQDGPS